MLVNNIQHFLKANPIDHREALTLLRHLSLIPEIQPPAGIADDKRFYGIVVSAGQAE